MFNNAYFTWGTKDGLKSDSYPQGEEMYSSVHLLSRVRLFATLRTAARQASLSFTISHSLLRLMSIESVMPSNYLILCHPVPLLPSILPSIRVFSSESALWIRWPKCYLIIICDLLSLRKCIVSCILYSCFSVISTHSSAFYLLIWGSHVLLRCL